MGLFFLTAFFVLYSGGLPVKAQSPKTEKKDKESAEEPEKFVNYGVVSVSDRHTLSGDRRHVSFSIINNSGRSIANIFGWIYRYEEAEPGKERNYLLVNFPHKGGVGENIRSHKPGQKAKWRFLLKQAVPKEEDPKLLLLVNMNSIFYSKTETIEPERTAEPDQAKEDKKTEKK